MDILMRFLKGQNDQDDEKNKQSRQIPADSQDRYEGGLDKAGLKSGKGTMVYGNGDWYEGEWLNNVRQGFGKQYYQNGDYYSGQWNKDKKEGKGQYFYSSNERYEGEWLNDYRNGFGSYFYKNGDAYLGQWVKGRREGRGQITYQKTNEVYDGEWMNDKKYVKGEGERLERHKSGKLVKEQDADNNGSQHDSDQGEAEDHQRKKDTPESPSKKDNASLHDQKHNESDFQNADDEAKPVEIQSNVREELAISGNQETHTNEGEIQNVYTNVDHSNRDNDFAIATNVESVIESNVDIKSNMIATEVVDTNDIYRTNGASLQISLDDTKAIDILEAMESYHILKNFPQDLREWTTEDVCRWLESIGLAEFSAAFETNQICGQSICMLKEEELEHAIGMKALGKRKIFQKYQEMLKKYYNKKLSKEAKSFIMKRSRQIKRGEKNLQNLKQGQPNYLSIREEDESASSAKNSLNSLNSSTRINGMENFMLLEEEDYEENRAKLNQPEKKKNNDDSNDQHRSKYSDDDEEDKSSHKANNVYEKHSRHNPSERSPKQDGQVDTSPTTKRKKRNKQKHIHRDQGGYGSSSDAKSDNPDHEPMLKNHSKSRENLASSAPSSREELGGGAKAKRRHSPSLNYFPQDEELSSQEFQGPKKDTFRHFADDEDEEMYKQLKNQKQKSAQHELHKNHSAGQFNRNNNNGEPSFIKVKPQFVSASVFSEDKIFADKVAVFQQNYQESKERVASQHDSRKQSSPEKQSEVVDIAQNDKGHRQIDQAGAIQEQEIVLALQQTANQQIQENQQQHNHHHQRQTKDEQSRGINAQETHSLDDQASRKTKKNEKRNKDENASSGSEAGTPDHRARSDDNASSQYHNSPDYLKNNDVHSIRPDFLLSKPFVLNYNTHHQTQLTSNDTYSTLHKLGIQKDMFQLDKSESQKSNGSYALGPQTSASLSGDNNTTVGNTKTMQSSANHNNNNNPSNQLINGQHNLIDSSSTSSEESSDEQSKPTAQTKRSKGDGGVSISSDSDQNNKQKQRQTPQQKYKKDPSAKESREPSKERANNNNNNGNANNTPQLKVKKKKAKDVIEVEKVKSRRDDREQQLEQLLRDMGINKKLIIDYTELEFGKKIGEGSYGQVFKGEWQRTDVAIKQFGKKNSKFHLRKVQDFISEVRVMNNLRHPNIVLYMGVCLYQSQYFMITEYLKEGSLFDHLHKLKTNFSETNLITMIEDMALGMVYLHGRKVMHCDLKSSNVLIDENWNVKLCDFGLSRIKSTLNKKKDERKAEGLVGTPQWMAPEIMRREQYQEHSDVYSFGMIMWELITKKIPYKGLSHQQIYGTVGYDNNYQVEIPKRGIPRYLNLMRKCLIREPSKRPTFQEIVDEVQLMKTDLKDNNKKQVVKEIIRFFD